MQVGAELGDEERAMVEGLHSARFVSGASPVHEDPPRAGGVHTNEAEPPDQAAGE